MTGCRRLHPVIADEPFHRTLGNDAYGVAPSLQHIQETAEAGEPFLDRLDQFHQDLAHVVHQRNDASDRHQAKTVSDGSGADEGRDGDVYDRVCKRIEERRYPAR